MDRDPPEGAVEGVSKRSIKRDYRIGAGALAKILANPEPVGYRQRTTRPKPRLGDFLGVIDCYADLFRRVRGKPEIKAVLLQADVAAMLALPATRFEVRRVEQASVDSLSLVRFDRNDYSVPTAFAHHDVTCLGSVEEVRILCDAEVVATHPRSWAKEGVFFDFRHYLALLERKPGVLDFARPLAGIVLPECLLTLRRRLESNLGHGGTTQGGRSGIHDLDHGSPSGPIERSGRLIKDLTARTTDAPPG